MEKILILDNYDSFTYNIVHLLHELGAEVDIAGLTSIEDGIRV